MGHSWSCTSSARRPDLQPIADFYEHVLRHCDVPSSATKHTRLVHGLAMLGVEASDVDRLLACESSGWDLYGHFNDRTLALDVAEKFADGLEEAMRGAWDLYKAERFVSATDVGDLEVERPACVVMHDVADDLARRIRCYKNHVRGVSVVDEAIETSTVWLRMPSECLPRSWPPFDGRYLPHGWRTSIDSPATIDGMLAAADGMFADLNRDLKRSQLADISRRLAGAPIDIERYLSRVRAVATRLEAAARAVSTIARDDVEHKGVARKVSGVLKAVRRLEATTAEAATKTANVIRAKLDADECLDVVNAAIGHVTSIRKRIGEKRTGRVVTVETNDAVTARRSPLPDCGTGRPAGRRNSRRDVGAQSRR